MRPYVQIGFMPEALSTHPEPYQHEWVPGGRTSISTGWAYPPKDFKKWAELVFQWVNHCVERYSKTEVEALVLGGLERAQHLVLAGHARGLPEAYDFAVDAVKRALPTARVGGPHVAGPGSPGGANSCASSRALCPRDEPRDGQAGSPLDFVAFHAKGSLNSSMATSGQGSPRSSRTSIGGFGIVASYPELEASRSSSASRTRMAAQRARRPSTRRTATATGRFSRATRRRLSAKYLLADKHGVNFEGAVTWAFEFEDQPYFAGFRVLSTNGIPLPVLNVFRMFGLMGGQRVSVESSAEVTLDSIRNQGVHPSRMCRLWPACKTAGCAC